ncbi:MAG: DUF4282 domain-containing protein [Gammaproteobacteria bacterium]
MSAENESRDNGQKGVDPKVAMQEVPERARRAGLWLVQYWKALFDFSFEKYMIIQMLPILYGMMLFAIGAGILYLIVEAFLSGSTWRGFFYLFFAGPLTFVVLASLLRALLEFYMVIFRVAEDVDELLGVRDTVDKLSGLADNVDEMASMTRRIPFWKVIFGGGGSAQRRLDASRRRSSEGAQQERRTTVRRASDRGDDGTPPAGKPPG